MQATDGIDIFQDLPPADLAPIERATRVTSVPQGHLFFAPGERGDEVYLLRSGRVRLYKLSPEGRALTLAVLEPPHLFGEMAVVGPRLHDSFAEAMTGCTVGIVAGDALRDAMAGHAAVALRLMELMGQRLRTMENKLSDIAFKSVPQRLATVLLGLAVPGDGGTPTVVRYTHQQLAEMIGSYRETVTKAIGEFRDGGLIRVDEDAISLTDAARLQALAGK
jgi:CRP-like cAMP-binding protein